MDCGIINPQAEMEEPIPNIGLRTPDDPQCPTCKKLKVENEDLKDCLLTRDSYIQELKAELAKADAMILKWQCNSVESKADVQVMKGKPKIDKDRLNKWMANTLPVKVPDGFKKPEPSPDTATRATIAMAEGKLRKDIPSPVGDGLALIIIQAENEWHQSKRTSELLCEYQAKAIRAYLLDGLPHEYGDKRSYEDATTYAIGYHNGVDACLKEIKERWGV
jgi:hypothetical protein